MTFSELSQDFLRTFSRHSEVGTDCLGLISFQLLSYSSLLNISNFSLYSSVAKKNSGVVMHLFQWGWLLVGDGFWYYLDMYRGL